MSEAEALAHFADPESSAVCERDHRGIPLHAGRLRNCGYHRCRGKGHSSFLDKEVCFSFA